MTPLQQQLLDGINEAFKEVQNCVNGVHDIITDLAGEPRELSLVERAIAAKMKARTIACSLRITSLMRQAEEHLEQESLEDFYEHAVNHVFRGIDDWLFFYNGYAREGIQTIMSTWDK